MTSAAIRNALLFRQSGLLGTDAECVGVKTAEISYDDPNLDKYADAVSYQRKEIQ